MINPNVNTELLDVKFVTKLLEATSRLRLLRLLLKEVTSKDVDNKLHAHTTFVEVKLSNEQIVFPNEE